MNSLVHFIVTLTIMIAIYGGNQPIQTIVIFTFVFGVLPDIDILIGAWKKKPKDHLRTFFQEPFGLLLIGVPVALVLSLLNPEYLMMSLIPFATHIVLDYLTIHQVSPFAPFSTRKKNVGYFRNTPQYPWDRKDEGGIPEYFLLLFSLLVLIILVFRMIR